jgi:APA family basic amino acid/polyamine antiporter
MRRKPVEHLVAEGGQGEGGSLRRSLGLWQLTMISIGATLGTGIFVVLGDAVPEAGPAVTLAFVIAGLTALFSALSYAELAGSIPVAGSSYSYAYATMGELVAWVCGWCLVLEYGVSVAAVAVGWGEYLNELLDGTIGVTIPDALSSAPGEGGTVSACAITIHRHSAGVSATPITLRDRPFPGTAKRSRVTVRPAASKALATRRCARRSAAPAAGRGPASARSRANA